MRHTYAGVTQADIAALKEVPEIARVGTYYVLSTENSPRGSRPPTSMWTGPPLHLPATRCPWPRVACLRGDHEVALGADWLAQYANGAGLGDAVTLDTPSFSGTYVVTGILGQETAAGAEFPHGPSPTPPWRGGRTTTPLGTWPTSTWPGTRPCLPRPSRPSTARRRRTWTSPSQGSPTCISGTTTAATSGRSCPWCWCWGRWCWRGAAW